MVFVLVLAFKVAAQTQEANFEVHFKGKSIGTLHAVDEKKQGKSLKDLRTVTDVKIIAMSIHVESEVASVYENGVLIEGTSYREANRGAEDVHAKVNRVGDKKYVSERFATSRRRTRWVFTRSK